jgi:hypothetical protein
MAEALVSPEVLRWARERAAMPVDPVAEKLKTGVEKVLAWVSWSPEMRQVA